MFLAYDKAEIKDFETALFFNIYIYRYILFSKTSD